MFFVSASYIAESLGLARTESLGFLLGGGIAGVIMVVVFTLLLRYLSRKRRLLEHGTPAVGTVAEVKPMRTKQGRGYRVVFEFRTRHGDTVRGH